MDREPKLNKVELSEVSKLLAAKLNEPGVTEESLASSLGISRGTLRKFRKEGSSGSYNKAIAKRLLAFADHRSVNLDAVYKYFEDGLVVPEQDRSKLIQVGSGHYVVYKMYSKGRSVLVTHLTLDVRDGGVHFTDRSSIGNPFDKEKAKPAEFLHHGMVFHKRTTVYFLSAASSNLRLMSVAASDFFGFGEASGLILGTNTDIPYASRIHIKRVDENTAKKLRGHYLETDNQVRKVMKFINNNPGESSVLPPYEPTLDEQA